MEINSKICILGFGSEGRAIADYLDLKGYKNITICDERADLREKKSRFRIKTGAGSFKKLEEFKYVFRSPGIHKDRKEIALAREKGAIITSGTRLFFDLCPCKIIGITGTKGKGTTSTLIYKILKEGGKDVYLGGNIGNSPFDFIDNLTKDSIVILELSSFQLHDLHKSPNISVVLNTTSEHLDYHKDVEEYLSAKENIVRYQNEDDAAIVNTDYPYYVRFMALTKGKRYYVSRNKEIENGAFVMDSSIFVSMDGKKYKICRTDQVGLIGAHNIENVLPAVLVGALFGINTADIKKTVNKFKGLPHRLEFIKKVDNVDYYNDSFSTTPETCIAAINSFERPIVLIAGGSEKNSDYTELGKSIASNGNIKTVVLMGDTAEIIEKTIAGAKTMRGVKRLNIIRANTYMEAFFAAKINSQPGDVVLLSPACASFGLFKNYKDRGDTFRKWVESL